MIGLFIYYDIDHHISKGTTILNSLFFLNFTLFFFFFVFSANQTADGLNNNNKLAKVTFRFAPLQDTSTLCINCYDQESFNVRKNFKFFYIDMMSAYPIKFEDISCAEYCSRYSKVNCKMICI